MRVHRQGIQYLRIQYKRMAGMAGKMLLAIFMVFLFMVLGILVIRMWPRSAGVKKLQIAIVVEGNYEGMFDEVIPYFNQMESIKGVCQIEGTSEQEARQGIQNGSYDVAVILDDEFYEKMNDYKNPEVDFLMSEQGRQNSSMFQELIQDGVALIRTVEAAMLSADQVIREDGASLSIEESEQLLLDRIVKMAFISGSTYHKIGVTDMSGYPILSYYGAGIVVVSLLTCGIYFGRIYSRENQLVDQMLRRAGVGIIRLGIYKVLPMASCLFVFGVIELFIWQLLTPCQMGAGIAGVAVLSLSIAAFFHFIYEWMGYESSSGMIFVLALVILVLLSGCLIPTVYFPEILYRWSTCNPVRIWQNALLVTVEDGYLSGMLVKAMVLGVVCFGIAEVGMWKRV